MSSLTVTANSSFNYQERVIELKEKLQECKQKISLFSKIDLGLIGFGSPYAAHERNVIALPSWILFKHDDIPARFLIGDINDPRLFNDRFLDDFFSWVQDKLINSIRRPDSNEPLQKLLLLFRDRDLFEKSKDFILGHEVGHLQYNEQRKVSWAVISVGIIGLLASFATFPLAGLAVGLVALGVALVITSVGIWKLPKLSRMEQENKADLDAVTMAGDSQGGIYYFKTMVMANQRLHLAGDGNFDEKGNSLGDKLHPPLTDRIELLRQYCKSSLRSHS